jgi:hypothetical protein
MSLLCGKNPALEALKSVQDSIKTALASKKAGLATLTSKLAEAKSKAESLVASLPNLSSFQAELAALAGATPEQVAQFKAKWDGKVAEIDSLISKATGAISGLANLDFCKDVPNVKMDAATGETVEEAKEAPTPNVAPAKAEPVVETVVAKSETVSSGESGAIPDDIESKYETLVVTPFQDQVRSNLWKDAHEKLQTELALKKSPGYYKAVLKRNTWTTDAELLAKADSPEEAELMRSIESAKLKRRAADVIKTAVDGYFKYRVKIIYQENMYWSEVKQFGNTRLKLADPGDPIWQHMQDIRPWLVKTDEIINANAEVVKLHAKYMSNTS